MLEESVPILEKSVKRQCMKHKDKGDLVESVKKTGANRNKYGYYICVRPTGKDRKGVRNMEKAAILAIWSRGKAIGHTGAYPGCKRCRNTGLAENAGGL